ncbi:permease prefix domain 1-containing protein [Kribbella sp. NPDC050124]|uniref:permease prefix domain 1-containing protein n=1 Tax=Kribbella sp. NPDC050124 TaxID=3364114 RepID=UPI0037A357C4
MADRDLIADYVAELARRLAPEIVEELADGLEESVRNQLSRGLTPLEAATAAVEEFGSPTEIAAAFARQSVGHRTAVALLETAPLFAVLWGFALIGAKAWNWPIPVSLACLFGVTLVSIAATLLTVVRSKKPSTARLAAPATVAITLLDLGLLTIVLAVGPVLTVVIALAASASLTRAALSIRQLPGLLAG